MGKSTYSPDRLDELRSENPALGFALYAMEPRGAVTFEVYTPDGGTYAFVGATAEEAMNLAFPVGDTSAPANSDAEEPASIFD